MISPSPPIAAPLLACETTSPPAGARWTRYGGVEEIEVTPLNSGRAGGLVHVGRGVGTLRVEFKASMSRACQGAVVRLCYDATMKKRPGGTTRLSISLPTQEAKLLRRRAKRIYDGNVSRVVSDAIRYIAYEEGRDALIASFGRKGTPTSAEAAQLDQAWGLVAKKSA